MPQPSLNRIRPAAWLLALLLAACGGGGSPPPGYTTYTTGNTLPYPNEKGDVVFGDFDGDGNLDVATADYTADASDEVASIFLGDGLGNLSSRIAVIPNPLPAGGAPLGSIALAVGDLDGNSIDDLVVVYLDNDSYAVFLGRLTLATDPPGTIATETTMDLGLGSTTLPHAAALADFDGGALDLVVAVSNTNEVAIYTGNGDGAFGPTPLTLSVATLPWDVATGNLDGNSNSDLAAVALQTDGSGTDLVQGFIGDGTGIGFTSKSAGSAAPSEGDADLVVADLDGDGRDDVVRTLAAENQVAVLLAQADGSLIQDAVYAVGKNPSDVAIGDVTGDTIPDIVTSNRADDSVTVLPGNGDGTFDSAGAITLPVPAAPQALALGDLDGNGVDDITTLHPASNLLAITLR